MRPFLTHALLVLALFGVITGSLLKPCDCGVVEALARGGGEAGSSSTPACCCCTDTEVSRTHPADAPGDDGSLKLCHKPRAPFGEPEAAVGFDVPTPSVFTLRHATADAAASDAGDLAALRAWTDDSRGTRDPWRVSPEGLVLFLI